jgi:hypothetical protein
MVPARQPKSLLRALKGSIVGPATTVGGEGRKERDVLESERARSQLATATSGNDAAALGGGVQSTRLLLKEYFSTITKEE